MKIRCDCAIRGLPRTVLSLVFGLLLCLALMPGTAPAAGQGDIGKIIACTPDATANRDGKTVALEVHSPIRASDTIATNATGRVKILFNDDSMVSLGPNTILDVVEYADSGTAPAFKTHVPQGVIRAITGKIVEQNPDGFKITTPEATVGIRGTLVSLRTGKGVTTVFVENTLRQVYVNGINVPSGNKITLPGDPVRPQPIQPEDRRNLGRDFALFGGAGVAAAAPEPGQVARQPEDQPVLTAGKSISPDTPLADIALGTQGLGDSLTAAVTPTTGFVKGSLASTAYFASGTIFYADFSFNVTLASGAISNAEMHSGTNISGMFDKFDVNGGTGILSGGTAVISGFTGTAISDVDSLTPSTYSIVPTDPTSMAVTSANVSVVGGSVSGVYNVDATSSGWSNVDSGNFSGTRIQ